MRCVCVTVWNDTSSLMLKAADGAERCSRRGSDDTKTKDCNLTSLSEGLTALQQRWTTNKSVIRVYHEWSRGSTARSLLRRLWSHMMSPGQDGGTRIRGDLAWFFYSERTWRRFVHLYIQSVRARARLNQTERFRGERFTRAHWDA